MVCSSDGEIACSLQARLRLARSRAAPLVSELSEQRAEMERIELTMRREQHHIDGLEAQLRTDMAVEDEIKSRIEAEEGMAAEVRRRNGESMAERKKLLRQIRQQQETYGHTNLAADQCIDVEIQCTDSRKKVERRTQTLRQTLKVLGDQQADLAECEISEKKLRREMRCAVRDNLQEEAETCAEIERLLGEREPELAALRMRLQMAREAEQSALEEAEQLQRETRRYENYYGPAQELLRTQLQTQLRVLAAEGTQLYEELQQARERLWRKEQAKHGVHPYRQSCGGG